MTAGYGRNMCVCMDIVKEVADEINQHDALHDSHMLAFICIVATDDHH